MKRYIKSYTDSLHQLKHVLFCEIRPMEYNLIIDLSGSYNTVLRWDPSRIQPPDLPRVFGLRWTGRSTLGRHSHLDNPAEEAQEDPQALPRAARPILHWPSGCCGARRSVVLQFSHPGLPARHMEAEVTFLLCSKAGMSSSGM